MSMNKVIHCAVRRDLDRFRRALDDDRRAAALGEFERLAPTLPDPVRLRYVTEVLVAVRR
jgi:hypothetical protein